MDDITFIARLLQRFYLIPYLLDQEKLFLS